MRSPPGLVYKKKEGNAAASRGTSSGLNRQNRAHKNSSIPITQSSQVFFPRKNFRPKAAIAPAEKIKNAPCSAQRATPPESSTGRNTEIRAARKKDAAATRLSSFCRSIVSPHIAMAGLRQALSPRPA